MQLDGSRNFLKKSRHSLSRLSERDGTNCALPTGKGPRRDKFQIFSLAIVCSGPGGYLKKSLKMHKHMCEHMSASIGGIGGCAPTTGSRAELPVMRVRTLASYAKDILTI